MSKSIPALINPSLLIWARDEAGYSPEEVAEKTHFPAPQFVKLAYIDLDEKHKQLSADFRDLDK